MKLKKEIKFGNIFPIYSESDNARHHFIPLCAAFKGVANGTLVVGFCRKLDDILFASGFVKLVLRAFVEPLSHIVPGKLRG